MKYNAFIFFAICSLFQIALGSLKDGKRNVYVVDGKSLNPSSIIFKEEIATGTGVYEVLPARFIEKTESQNSMKDENEKLKAELLEQSKELRQLKKFRTNTGRTHPLKTRIKKTLHKKYMQLLKKLRVGVIEQLRLINEEISELESSDKSAEFL